MTSPPDKNASLKHWALFYAGLGFPVAPYHRVFRNGVCSCGDKECPKPGKHPKIREWKERATTEPEQIESWWTEWVFANITLMTGAEPGLVVLDFDGTEGMRTYNALQSKFRRFPTTPISRSGGGGLHVWFRHPGRGVYVPTGDGILGPGADVKGDGGAITVPPSGHASGNRYEWTTVDLNTELAPVPVWVLEQLDRARETGETAISETEAGQAHQYRRARSLTGEAYELPASIGSGGRNDELHRYASSLRARGADAHELEQALHEANNTRCSPPLTSREIEWIVKSATKYPPGERRGDPLRPRSAAPRPPEDPWFEGLPAEPPPSDHPSEELPEPPPWLDDAPPIGETAPPGGAPGAPPGAPPGGGGASSGSGPPKRPQPVVLAGPDGITMTDVGNAERMFRDHGQDLRYVAVTKRWYTWTGQRWQHDQRYKVRRLAAMTARRMHPLIGDCFDEDHQKKWRTHIKSAESAKGIVNALDCLSMHKEVARDTADLDRDTDDLLNTPTGTLNLRTLELKPHEREPMITKIARTKYDPKAKCPQWDRFLLEIMGGDAEMVAFLQRAVGYGLTGHTTEHCLFFLHGIGRNGKSTFIETIRHMVGDYGRVADFNTFLDRPNDTMRNDLAALRGARMVTAGEPDLGKRFSEGVVKSMTGGDVISCRHLYGDFFEYKPAYKIFLAANHKPTVRGQDEGIWRRFRMIPFEVQIPEQKKDLQLGDKLRAEWPGILAWAAKGAAQWYRGGLQPPTKVLAATKEYREEMDSIGQFVRDCFFQGDQYSGVPSKLVYDAYKEWCERHGEYVRPQRQLARLLKERGYETIKRGGKRVYLGWGLKDDEARKAGEED